MEKKFKGFRLTSTAVSILERLAERLGLSMTGVIEIALRQMGEREGIAQNEQKATTQGETVRKVDGA